MKKVMLMMLLFCGFLCGCTDSKEISYTQISMQEALSQMKDSDDFVLLDVRTSDEYLQSHIPNAINLANESITEETTQFLKDKKQILYVYCRSGNRSKQASEKLVKLGYENVIEIGGINDYPYSLEK